MLLPALLLAPALLLPAASVAVPAPSTPCVPIATAAQLSGAAGAPWSGLVTVRTVSAEGTTTARHTDDLVAVPAQAPATTTPAATTPATTTPATTTPATDQPAPTSDGRELKRWQAAVIAVVVAGAVVWLVGKLRTMGRRR